MAKKYYLDLDQQEPLHPMLVKIGRFIAKRTGEDVEDVLSRLLTECLRYELGREDAIERFHAKSNARKRYCEAEGLDEETFENATLEASLKRTYRELRRDWTAL